MLTLKDDTLARRAFLQRCAASAFGLSLIPLASQSASADPSKNGFGKAKNVIWLMMSGGMSHIDTFDPKTGDTKGPGGGIKNTAGEQFNSFMEKTAKVADKISVIRSMTGKIGVHDQAQYFMRTAYKTIATLLHPMLGAHAQAVLGPSHKILPSTVCINQDSKYGNGFLPASMSPLPILDPEAGLQFLSPKGTLRDLQETLSELDQLDRPFREQHPDRNVKAYTEFYDKAVQIMGGKDGEAFDLRKESAATRDAYGRSKFGQGCLLARRLVESGVRFVEVDYNGWDFHFNIVSGMEEFGPILDQGYSQLIRDLDQRGLLKDTLVVLTTEFGRTPAVGAGRGHYPPAFSTVLAGGGVKGGYIHGATDAAGGTVTKNPVNAGDLHATVGWAMGIDLEKPIKSPSGRPIPIGGHGAKVVSDLFA